MTSGPSPGPGENRRGDDPPSRLDRAIPLDRLVLERGPLPLERAVDLLIQAARGLDAAPARGPLRQELGPAGLLVDASWTLHIPGVEMRGVSGSPGAAPRPDPRDDMPGLGRTLYLLLTGREPSEGEALRELRPDLPAMVDETFRRLTAEHRDDRPASMSEVVFLLEACLTAAAGRPEPGDVAPTPSVARPRNRRVRPPQGDRPPRRSGPVPGRRDDPGSRPSGHPAIDAKSASDVRSEATIPAPTFPARGGRPGTPSSSMAFAWVGYLRRAGLTGTLALLAAFGLMAALVVYSVSRPPADRPISEARAIPTNPSPPAPPQPEWVEQTLLDGKRARGWMLTNGRPLPPRAVGPDGLNPHGTGSYLVVHEHKVGDFILDLDYRLSQGCETGVFLRVGSLDDPVHTGIEVALADSVGVTEKDPGAFSDLLAPARNAQKPAGAWNHLTITARGPSIAVALNGVEVNRIDLDEWSEPGRRPDGTEHGLKGVAPARLPRKGYIGFQDLIGDCWFRRIVLKTPAPSPP